MAVTGALVGFDLFMIYGVLFDGSYLVGGRRFGQPFAGKHPTCCVTGDRSVTLRSKSRDGSSCHFGMLDFCGRCDVMDEMSQFGLGWAVHSVCGVTSTYAY